MVQLKNKYEQFGVHLMIDAYGASQEALKNKLRLKELLLEIPTVMGMHTICDPIVVEVGPKNHKDPGGVSGFVMIAESHLSFHTFPNRGFITIDVYTCQNNLDTNKLVEIFQNEFGFITVDTYVQKRGLRYPASDIY